MSTTYKFTIHTVDQANAGTDSNIFLKLYGDRGISPEVRLNKYISGNAFERNKTDTCSIEYDKDYGEIYMIEVRSDMQYAAPDWLCDYFKIEKKDDPDYSITVQFPSGYWINNKENHRMNATSGYDFDLPTHTTEYRRVYGGFHYIPPNIKFVKTIKTSVLVDVDYNRVDVFETSTQTSLEVEYQAIKAAFDFQINTSLNEQVDNKLQQVEEIITEVTIDGAQTERTLQEIWNESEYNFTAKLGSDTYSFTIPYTRTFAGFKEVPTMWTEVLEPLEN